MNRIDLKKSIKPCCASVAACICLSTAIAGFALVHPSSAESTTVVSISDEHKAISQTSETCKAVENSACKAAMNEIGDANERIAQKQAEEEAARKAAEEEAARQQAEQQAQLQQCQADTPVAPSSSQYSGSSDLRTAGVLYDSNYRYTYYSSNVLYHYRTPEWTPDSNGYYRDSDGYVVVASSDHAQGTVINSEILGPCKVYDSGCASGTLDVYTNY